MIDEFEMIDRIRGILRERGAGRDRTVEVDIGDDAAAIHLGGGRRLLATTDAMVEGVHFDRRADRPGDVGYRAFAANVSDISAMGGRPRWALLSLVLPGTTDADWVEALVRGVADAAKDAGAAVVGGNLSGGGHVVVSVTLLGETRTMPLRRSGALAGDGLYLTGPVGASAAALAGAAGGAATAEGRALRERRGRPPMRIEAAAALAGVASAAIDVSDGLVQDLRHMLEASGVSARIDLARIPLAFGHPREAGRPRLDLALGGGEDYEIVAAVPPAAERPAGRLLAEVGSGLYRFGVVSSEGPPGAVVAVHPDGSEAPIEAGGFRHFGAPPSTARP